MAKVFANSEDPHQTPHSAASDLGLHCLPVTLLGVSQLQRVKETLQQQIHLMATSFGTNAVIAMRVYCYKVDLFKFWNTCGQVLRCPNI